MQDGIVISLKISEGNSKIGGIPNLSLPPVDSCRPDAPCIQEGCYALNICKRWPSVMESWRHNLNLYKTNPDQFFHDLALYLSFHNPKRFRLHVGGDFPDAVYFLRMAEVFAAYPGTSVLCFTKRYDLPLYAVPRNMKIILSAWPGLDLPLDWALYPVAWLEEDLRAPGDGQIRIICPGGCEDCGHACWDAVSADLPVVFKKHR